MKYWVIGSWENLVDDHGLYREKYYKTEDELKRMKRPMYADLVLSDLGFSLLIVVRSD